MNLLQSAQPLLWLYAAILLLALAASGFILYRRWQSRRALVARVADLTVLAAIGRAITDAPLDLRRLADVVYRQAGQIVDTGTFQLGLFEGERYRLLIWILDGQPQPTTEFRLSPGAPGIVGWMRESKQSLLVRDFEAERHTLPAQPRYLSPNPPRSAVFVPLIVGESVLGAIAIQSRKPNAFSEQDLRLLSIVANHAAAALEKARVYEQAERRATQLALLSEVTKQINVLQPLLSLYRQIVELVAEKFGGHEVTLFEHSNGVLTLRATTVPEWIGWTISLKSGEDHGAAIEAATTCRTVVHEDLPEWGQDSDHESRSHREGELAVPLKIGNRVLGVLSVRSRAGDSFDSSIIDLFESLAGQVAFAILEAELYAAEHRRSEQLATIAQVSRTIVSTLELGDLLDEVLDRVEENFGYKRAHIFLLENDSLVFQAGVGKGAARWSVQGLAHDLHGPGLIPLAGRTRQPILVGEVTAHPDYLMGAGLEDTRSEMAAPMIMGDKLLGVFDVQSETPDYFTDEDLKTLQTLADTLAIAVRNVRLFELERRRRQLAETMREVSVALTSTLNLDDVLDLILDGLARVISFDAASILLTNDLGELVLRAVRGAPELVDAIGEALDVRLYPKGETLPTIINFGDVDHRGEYHDLLALPDPHACLGAVLSLRGEHIGYLVVDRVGEPRFPRGEVEVIATFASQAAVAIENARLFTAQLEQAWVSTALLQVAESTTQASELDEIVQMVARLTPMLVGVDRCAVLVAEEGAFVVKAYYGDGATMPSIESLPPFAPAEWPKLREIMQTREPVVITTDELSESLPADLRPLFTDVVILLPLLAKGELEGLLAVGQVFGEAPFNSHRIQLLAGIANQTALAIESMMLYEAQQAEAWVSAALLQVAEAVAQQGMLEEGLAAVARLTPMLVGIERVAIFQWDGTAGAFRASQIEGLAKSNELALVGMSLTADDLGIDPADDRAPPSLEFVLPSPLAECFETGRAMVWPLRARGDLLGALMVEYEPPRVLGRRLSILDGIAHQLSLAMENARLTREVALQQKLERDIELGRDIQASFLPKACPVIAGWEVCSFWQAARQVGGDFYDFIPLRPEEGRERWGIVIADVADKGVPAALFMALSRTLMRTVAISRVWPATTLSRVNELIFADAKTDLFVTVVYAVWEPATGNLRYVIAGHNPPVRVGPTLEPQVLPGRGVALGVFEDVTYQEHDVQLAPGDVLLLYTDGLPDAINAAGEEFGVERVKGVMSRSHTLPAEAIVEALTSSVRAHAGVTEPFDDLTMMVIKRRPMANDSLN